MKVVDRICLEDTTFFDPDDPTLQITLKRCQEYTTTERVTEGQVTVFSRFWFRAPVSLFAGAVPVGGRHGK